MEYLYFPLDGMLVHLRVTPGIINFSGTHLYTWVERGTVRGVLPKNTKCPQLDKPRPLDKETSALTTRSLYLPKVNLNLWKTCHGLSTLLQRLQCVYDAAKVPDTRESWHQCLCPPKTINQKVSTPGKFWKYLEDFQLSSNQVTSESWPRHRCPTKTINQKVSNPGKFWKTSSWAPTKSLFFLLPCLLI